MKENVFDVLLYLFENYIDNDEADKPDQDALETELEHVGFPESEIHKAFEWLESMTVVGQQSEAVNTEEPERAMRHYTPQEQERLTAECRGYMLFLEQIGVLDAGTREIVIERLFALDTDEIDLDQMKWVVLMVLFFQPDRDVAYAWMEDLVFEDMEAVIH
ncbi:MAG: hypothetical protein COA83_00865 [Methylophaga sp.]|nr:MAG: hypothetical protein COA83_00865 [Methylophaga sp.]